jgi:hypothetical protein
VGRRGTQIAGTVVLVGVSLLSGACAPAHEPVAPHTRAPSTLAAQYLRIAAPANRRLESDFDRLAGPDRDHLADALGDLRDAASTERMFDRDLLRLSLPPAVEVTAQDLVRTNESRAKLTSTLSAYRSLEQLRRNEKSLTAANAPVEQAVRSVRRQLGLPPPQTS